MGGTTCWCANMKMHLHNITCNFILRHIIYIYSTLLSRAFAREHYYKLFRKSFAASILAFAEPSDINVLTTQYMRAFRHCSNGVYKMGWPNWISISFCAHLHPFCRGNWTGDGQIARAAWKNNCCTLKVQLQRSHPFDGQKQCGSQEKQNYHCMVAGVSLEEYAFGQMSNQQWEKPDLPQLKPGSLAKTVGYLQLRSFTFLHTISV